MLETDLASDFKSCAWPILYVGKSINQQLKSFATLLLPVDILKHRVWGGWKNNNASFSAFQTFPEKGDETTLSLPVRQYFLSGTRITSKLFIEGLAISLSLVLKIKV